MASTARVLAIVLACICAAAIVAIPFTVSYERSMRKRLCRIRETRARRPGPDVFWQAGRWDRDPCHAYLANLGDDTAFEVSVRAGNHIVSVPPFRVEGQPSARPPGYVRCSVPHWSSRPGARSARPRSAAVLEVDWRSASGTRFHQTVSAD